MDAVSNTRQIVMQVVKRNGEPAHHVEFTLDDNFAERLRQLRSLVPPLTGLNRARDLVIDKVRARLPAAIWRCGAGDGQEANPVEGSCIVIAAEGFFNCGAKDSKSKEKLVTYTFPISRLIELHVERPSGETFFIRNGIFTNDEPADSSAGRWVALLHEAEHSRLPEGPSHFDTLPGGPHSDLHIPITQPVALGRN
ncbi:hypothetical protein AX767_20735 [Variovorax sp. PAMC 28711]|nr:hypothetical protein AX767_20735 [Variovorax sp. PAMC 28711]